MKWSTFQVATNSVDIRTVQKFRCRPHPKKPLIWEKYPGIFWLNHLPWAVAISRAEHWAGCLPKLDSSLNMTYYSTIAMEFLKKLLERSTEKLPSVPQITMYLMRIHIFNQRSTIHPENVMIPLEAILYEKGQNRTLSFLCMNRIVRSHLKPE